MKVTSTILRICIALWLMAGFHALLAQDDIIDDEENNSAATSENCVPSSLDTPYSKFQADSISARDVEIWFSFGQENFKHGQYQKAIPYYWKVMLNDKSGRYEKFTYSKLAECYIELGKTASDARTYLDSTLIVVYKGLDKYPDNATLHYRAGTLHRSLGQTRCAIPHYEALVKLNAKEPSYLKVLAGLLFEIEDERCIDIQQKLVELEPTAENNIALRQMLEFFGKDPMQAIIGAYMRDSTNVANALSMGKEALVVGNYKMALRAFNQAIKISPKNLEAFDGKAKALEGLGDMNGALNTYKQMAEIAPENVSVLNSLAMAYANVKNFSSARSYALRARRLDPNNGQSYMVMGHILEVAVDYCSGKREKNEYTYDDKLVFERAAREYAGAKRDPNYAAQAESRVNALQPFFRTTEEKFLKNDRTTINDSCYDWLK